MKLNLRDIIEVPGASVPFDCEPDLSEADFPALLRFTASPRATGTIKNSANALTLTGTLTAEMLCVCDRCNREFELSKTLELNVPLAAELEDEESADIFLLEDDCVDLNEVLETCFILEQDSKLLCSEDCAGLCEDCGANLNDGKCSCPPKIDPRLAALTQLLDIDNPGIDEE